MKFLIVKLSLLPILIPHGPKYLPQIHIFRLFFVRNESLKLIVLSIDIIHRSEAVILSSKIKSSNLKFKEQGRFILIVELDNHCNWIH